MRIALCLDYSSFTAKALEAMHQFVMSLKEYEITVIHIIDESLLFSGTGYETQLSEDLARDGEELKQLCIQALGEKMAYIEEYGIPRLKTLEVLATLDYDLLAFGSHSKSILGNRLLGGVAENLFRSSTKPILLIP
jgi:nucleotide-binding universal stress UspA family protein